MKRARFPTLGRFAIAVVLSWSGVVPAYAQQGTTRSQEIGRPPDKEGEVVQGRYIFAGIGIDDYEHDEIWAGLDNAVNDVVAVREMLQGTFKFEAPEEWLLTNEEATAANIRILIDDLRLNLLPDDNLVFFFAGLPSGNDEGLKMWTLRPSLFHRMNSLTANPIAIRRN